MCKLITNNFFFFLQKHGHEYLYIIWMQLKYYTYVRNYINIKDDKKKFERKSF